MKRFKTKYGFFAESGKEYVITTPRTPRPWINVISNGDYGITVSQTGSGYSVIAASNFGIDSKLLMFVPNDEPLEIWKLTLRNRTKKTKQLDLFSLRS